MMRQFYHDDFGGYCEGHDQLCLLVKDLGKFGIDLVVDCLEEGDSHHFLTSVEQQIFPT